MRRLTLRAVGRSPLRAEIDSTSTPGDVRSTAKLYAMARKLTPLLCELHAHTTWSDGKLELREVVDLYGRRGFDVLCITDHVIRPRDPWTGEPVPPGTMVQAENFAAYLTAIDAEAERASALYDLLVLPGVELTYDDTDPTRAAHAVAVGLRSFIDLEDGLEPALADARANGAALIAAHPYSPDALGGALRGTAAWAVHAELARAVDRFEIVNRHELFSWVGAAGFPGVASGDFHIPEHLATWKTLLPCTKTERSVVDYLRSHRPAYLVDLGPSQPHSLAA